MDMNKIERLTAEILALSKNKRMTAVELSKTFEVGLRTIYRDIQALSEMNVPIVAKTGTDGGYSLLDDYFIPPVVFNADEVFAMLLSKKVIKEVNIPGYTQYVNSAFFKMESNVYGCLLRRFENLQKRIFFDIKNMDVDISEQQLFYKIIEGLESNRRTRVKIYSPCKMEDVELYIRPYGLIYRDGIWLIVAFCEVCKQIEHFRMDRIREVVLKDEAFALPDAFDIQDYSGQRCYYGEEGNDKYEIVKIAVDKSRFYLVKDYVFFKYDELTEQGNKYILTIGTVDAQEYVKLALRFFDCIEILEPLWLKNKVMESLEDTYKKYRKD